MVKMKRETREIIESYADVYRIAMETGLLEEVEDEFPDVVRLIKESGILN